MQRKNQIPIKLFWWKKGVSKAANEKGKQKSLKMKTGILH